MVVVVEVAVTEAVAVAVAAVPAARQTQAVARAAVVVVVTIVAVLALDYLLLLLLLLCITEKMLMATKGSKNKASRGNCRAPGGTGTATEAPCLVCGFTCRVWFQGFRQNVRFLKVSVIAAPGFRHAHRSRVNRRSKHAACDAPTCKL